MANFFTNLFSSGASNLVDSIGEAIDKNFTTDDERLERRNELDKAEMAYKTEMAHIQLDTTKAFLEDTANARENQTAIQTSENATWLAKNIHPMLALGIVGLTFFMFYMILNTGVDDANKMSPDKKEIIIYILGALTTIATQVAAYFFGSSQGSKDKQNSLNNLAMKVKDKL